MSLPPDPASADPNPSQESSPSIPPDRQTSPSPKPNEEFAQALEQLERSLQTLRGRYEQVIAAQQRQAELQDQLQHVNVEGDPSTIAPDLLAERQRIEQELAELEVILESRLISWDSLKEGFWQALRFGGLGIVIGWVLRTLANN